MHLTLCILTIDYAQSLVYNIIKMRGNLHKRKGDKTMSRNELITKIEALQEWEAIMEEAKAEAEALRDIIKNEMLEQGTEELEAGTYIVRWTSVLTNRFDTTAFKKEHGDLYKQFTKQIASKRFSIA